MMEILFASLSEDASKRRKRVSREDIYVFMKKNYLFRSKLFEEKTQNANSIHIPVIININKKCYIQSKFRIFFYKSMYIPNCGSWKKKREIM